MSIRFTARTRRGVVALAVAVGLVTGASACGGGDDGKDKEKQPTAASSRPGSAPSTQEGQSEAPLAEMKGPSGLLLRITAVQRDSGGFVTVQGSLKNDGGSTAVIPSSVRGNETEILKNGSSLGGATLVDPKGKKRYYVLRDTDGRPLTTTGLTALKAGAETAVFMQFPAPPADTSDVDFQLPGFAPATIKIS
ncbi:hypothetical protein [Streptomyces sp. NPDC091385]|uniref:hypothetical protein n=1 Tax=Streptomyces sp. NPDC091385 TaxID=3365997 RepID=UPI00381018EA